MSTHTFSGNVTADPELRFLRDGTAVASFTLAVNDRVFDKASGEWKDGETLWLRCTAWRQFAENITESVTKGTRVVVTGKLKSRTWEGRDGDKRTSLELDIEDLGTSLKYATATVRKTGRSSQLVGAGAPAASASSDPFAVTGESPF